MEIPKILIDHIRDGQVVLFLGSGASIGANHPEGIEPPIGSKLAGILAEKFLDDEFKKRPLDQVAELAISETGLFEVQSFIAEIFNDFTPVDFHKTIPTFKWAAIATTNYDLIIEKAYNEVEKKLQNLIVFKKNGERVEEKLRSFDNVVYLKLHGCITNIADHDTPLILTPEQYITHKEGRSRLFERLQSLAYEFPILFVGHSLADSDIRIILYELSQLKEAKPRSYILTPKITSTEKRFWETKKFTCLESTFEGFVHELDRRISTQFRSLAKFKAEAEHPIFNKFSVSENIRPSESLLTLLSRGIEYIHKGYKTTDIDPRAFYRGFFTDLSPIIHDLDVRRAITDDILLEVFLESEIAREHVQFFVIKGHAGSGKSVLLRRLAWEASVDYDKLCLLINSNSHIGYEPLYELHRLTKERLFLFIDPVTEHQNLIELLIEKARKDKLPLTILSAERHNEWNTECEELEPYLTDNYDIEYLQPKEIESLIHLLTKYDSLGHLKGLKLEQQMEALSKKAGRQLLVALHEATLGKIFSDIILDEYHSITSPEAQSLYLTVCILHRLGVHTRAGLISRVHGIPFSLFKDKLFKPLDFIVFASRDELIKDYYYRSRHSHIAEMVFERVLVEQQDRFDEYVRLIDNLDIDYKSDREAFKGLLNAKQLLQLFQDPQKIRQLFTAANERVKNDPKLMQQEAILEMNRSDGNLNRATELLETAHSLAPHDKAIAHSLSVLALNKANKSATELEKNKLRKESRKIAYQLISQGTITSHPYHTLIRIGLDELSALMKQVDDQTVIERKIKEVEKVISEAIQAFPDSSHLLDEEARFSELVEKHPKAIESLERAFKANKRSPYIASRLARTYENEGKTDKAIKVLRECLDANPSDKYLNYRLAILLMKQTDTKSTDIKHHLRRSFTQGDSNYAAQFWYARLLYLEGELTEATEQFQRLSDVKIDIRIKKEPRGIVTDGEAPIRFSGTITQMESSYGFLVRDGENDSFFTHFSFSDASVWKKIKSQDRVTFEIGFNYRGPVALNIKPEN
jgi:cold shock CspA family protein/TolA-binding protein/sRNA-binding regulator protein Hfq